MGKKNYAYINPQMLVWARSETPFETPESVELTFPTIGEIIKKLGEKYKLPDYITIEKRKSFIVNNYEITEDFLNEVREYLPAQPWPAGIHKVIAETIGSTNSKVYRAIDELIERGIFRAQIDGKITN